MGDTTKRGIIMKMHAYLSLLVLGILVGQAHGTLIGHYKFDNSGVDSAPALPNPVAVLNADTVYTNDAKIGEYAVSFDGSGDYISLGDNFDAGLSDLTIACWIKTTEIAFARIISKESAVGYKLSVHSGTVSFQISSTIGNFSLPAGSNYNDGQFHHIAATFDRDGDGTMYWDGEAIGTADISSHAEEDLNTATALYVGWRSGGGSGAFNGIIDDFRIYDQALSAEGISDLIPKVGTLIVIY